MTLPTSDTMADAVASVFSALYERGILKDYGPVETLRNSLYRKKGSDQWSIFIGAEAPIIFKEIEDKKQNKVQPTILANLEIDTSNHKFPYKKWDICLQLTDTANQKPLTKWHFDLASDTQSGPRIHMQCGGHFTGNVDRTDELCIDVPRWHHPAIDLLLLTEIAVANFYEEEWKEIRELPNWCKSMNLSQHLCYGPYLTKISPIMDQSSITILKEVWNDNWT